MKITMIAALSIATAATTLPQAAVAHADNNNYQMFQSPSGNIHCHIYTPADSSAPLPNARSLTTPAWPHQFALRFWAYRGPTLSSSTKASRRTSCVITPTSILASLVSGRRWTTARTISWHDHL